MRQVDDRKIRRRSLLLSITGLIVVLGGWALADHQASQQAPAATSEELLAVVGGEQITDADVESAIAGQLIELRRQRHHLVEQALDRLVARKLVELEADERGVAAEELMAQEVHSKIGDITEGEVDAFYEARKGQINRPKEQVADQIREFLANQKRDQVYGQFIAKLKEKHGVQTYLDPLRLEVGTAGAPSVGPTQAPVTIVEFSDFECPYCGRLTPTLDQVLEAYGDKVRLVFRQFPLPIHRNAQKAAEASLCAHAQGKFWEMHDAMFSNQSQLAPEQLKETAERLELDTAAFGQCLESGEYAGTVADDLAAGRELGVSGTPAMFINGRFISGAVPYEQIAEVIDDELERRD